MVKSLFNNIRNKLKRFRNSNTKPDQKPEATSDPEQDVESRDKILRGKPVASGDAGTRKGAAAEGDDSDRPEAERPRPKRRRPRKKGKAKPEPAVDDEKAAPARHDGWDLSSFEVPVAEGKTRFHDLDLPGEILHAVADLGFQYCSPIQAEILPATLMGKDASGQAQTGTGKTAAFLITMLATFIRNPIQGKRALGTPRALVLAPTRELVIQIAEEARLLSKYYPCNIVSVFGGMDYQKQRRELTEHVVDIIVATPGRLIDYCQYEDVQLNKLEILVIDEADRMLDMGFMPQVRRIVRKTPYKEKRQTLLFSATMTGEVERLSSEWTREPLIVEVEPEQVEVASVEQLVYLVTTRQKPALLYNIIQRQNLKRVIIFCNRRDETHRVADFLNRYDINCAVISGEVPQKRRLATLEKFRSGHIRVLVATDVAGRGLHIDGISHVINFAMPHEPENYVHRIGRTGRAGATGTSVSFACEDDSFYIPDIETFIGHELHCTQPDDAWLKLPDPAPGKGNPERRSQGPKRRSRRRTSRPRTRKPS
ncbi:DEAD/DEAH box helicase [Desulfococcus multivorans]|uniref:DEAD/DEAH box helicase domain protein n=1 Tax=Desulfococcus multivorans DSM 2059 TaxID=1121405 RepID=S7UXX6_DESML|nr:DEAD/DEAH box helicase [Desulfococcus multivorans]AQV01258.1 ATP-dependent RNA helicase RhlB [Desulfococcus multivorans]EPR39099.1 DEAD/DEAH box helicase domain protein [Desulfococcus multivorans DSM 2059]SJZ55013.1 ATP-dependent RNA helicase RhlB [Desulfococcus multivorans DSM 2059]